MTLLAAPRVVGYLTIRRAGAAVSASQLAEFHARTQGDDRSSATRIDQPVKYLGPLVIHRPGPKDHPLGDGARGARAAT